MMARGTVEVTVRLPADLADVLEDWARSMRTTIPQSLAVMAAEELAAPVDKARLMREAREANP